MIFDQALMAAAARAPELALTVSEWTDRHRISPLARFVPISPAPHCLTP